MKRLAHLAQADADLAADDALAVRVEALVDYIPLADALERSWLDDDARRAPTWTGHRNINAVALATSLAPGGWLGG